MKDIIYIFFTFIIIKCKEILYNHTKEENDLYFIFTTFRHGARHPFVNKDFFGNIIKSPGSLTKYGSIQNLEIGKKYRQRYSNFLNMEFDKNEIYIRSSDVERTLISMEKQLEGLFNKTIDRKNFNIVKEGLNFKNLYHLNKKEKEEMDNYFNLCNKRKLNQNFSNYFNSEIFPILQDCYNINKTPNFNDFCDSVFSSYDEYAYNNDINNNIGKCGSEKAIKMHDFCFEWANSFKEWDEYGAYMFYKLFKNIFNNMNKAINNNNTLKMMMIGGHGITVDKLMNFLDGLKIIPRKEYPHYAFNMVIELRKYNNDFYLEFYYNDILKYNNTLNNFTDILQKSKYSNLYNYCGTSLKSFLGVNEDKNLFIFIISLLITSIIVIIIIIIFYFIWKRKKKFVKLIEEKVQIQKSVSVIGITESTKKDEEDKNDSIKKDEEDKTEKNQ